jgi:dephospho-CoA kinase
MGAGKSVAVDFFRDLGWPVYPSDERAKNLVAGSAQIQSELVNAFGSAAIRPDGTPNASHLGVLALLIKGRSATRSRLRCGNCH